MVKKKFSYPEISEWWSEFENFYNAEFMNESEDYNYALLKKFFNENNGFRLVGKYNDIVIDAEGKKKIVYDCLYNFTNEYVREYFGNIPKEYDPYFKWERNTSNKKIRS